MLLGPALPEGPPAATLASLFRQMVALEFLAEVLLVLSLDPLGALDRTGDVSASRHASIVRPIPGPSATACASTKVSVGAHSDGPPW